MDIDIFSSNFVVHSDRETGTLSLGGKLTIEEASSLKECLLEALSQVHNCLLDLEKVKTLDLACLQIFYAAHIAAKKSQKFLNLAGDCPTVLRNVVIASGFDHLDWLKLHS